MQNWTSPSLAKALLASALADQAITATASDVEDGVVHLTLPELGDLPVTIAIGEGQILVSSPICTADQVKNRAAFNDACLRLNLHNPLSNIGITTIDDADVYLMFGEMSLSSTIDQIVEEIEALGANTIEAAQLLQSENN